MSVVIPFRNAAVWLEPTLASLISQRGVDWELVAVDDGSSDDSAAVLQECWSRLGRRDPHSAPGSEPIPMRLLQLGQGGRGVGVSAARNAGWRAAQAPLVAFLDADDLALPGRLATQAAAFDADPGLAHVLSGWRRFGAEGLAAGFDVCPWREGAGFGVEEAFRFKAVLPSAWMLRRSALEQLGGFDTALTQAEDVDLLLRLALAGLRGTWVRQVLCGYRVHRAGASRQLQAQARSLLWVTRRRLQDLPTGHPLTARGQELVFAARAWSAWQAWNAGDQNLALELWRSSWGMSPLGPARTWLHLAQGVESHCRREGVPFTPQRLLQDPAWRALETHVLAWLEHRRQDRGPAGSPAVAQSDGHGWGWSLLVFAHREAGLAVWRQQLQQQTEALATQLHGETMPGRGDPDQDSPEDAGSAAAGSAHNLAALRQRALAWMETLLAWSGPRWSASGLARPEAQRPADAAVSAEHLIDALLSLLEDWARLCWSQSAVAVTVRLEQAFALRPQPHWLRGLAAVHQPLAPTGAAALLQLAERLEAQQEALTVAAPSRPWPSEPPPQERSRCIGPGCDDCGLASLEGWRRLPLSPGCERWLPPPRTTAPARPLQLWRLAGGQAWLRPPLASPWGTTAAVAVATASGEPVPELCRRYPQPWPVCREQASLELVGTGVEPMPGAGAERLHLPGRVLALADLSAEIYYHWLLDQLPRLGLAMEGLAGQALKTPQLADGPLWLWHNGGDDPRRLGELAALTGLPPERIIDGRRHPWIQADLLLVPAYPHRFGWPSTPALQWLRDRFLTPSIAANQVLAEKWPKTRIWLGRRGSGRRAVLGERRLLARLAAGGCSLASLPLERMALAQQARAIASAELIVAPHGGALANLAFASPGTHVLELHQPRYAPPYFHAIAAALGLELFRCAQPATVPSLYQDLVYESPLSEPIMLDPDRVMAALEAMAASAPPGR